MNKENTVYIHNGTLLHVKKKERNHVMYDNIIECQECMLHEMRQSQKDNTSVSLNVVLCLDVPQKTQVVMGAGS